MNLYYIKEKYFKILTKSQVFYCLVTVHSKSKLHCDNQIGFRKLESKENLLRCRNFKSKKATEHWRANDVPSVPYWQLFQTFTDSFHEDGWKNEK